MSEHFKDLSPKWSFVVGLVAGVLVLCTIGFFILLVVVLGDDKGSAAQPTTAPTVNVQPTAQPTAAGTITMKAVSKDDHIRGDEDAKVTLVEYSDIDCPFCRRFHPTLQQVVSEYAGKVRWVYRHFPLDSLHPNARTKAEATECVADIGGNDKFWAFLDKIVTEDVTPDQLGAAAASVGVDQTKFQNCYNAKQFASAVQADEQDATTAGGTGTPYTVVIDAKGNKTPVSGAVPIDNLKRVIDAALQN